MQHDHDVEFEKLLTATLTRAIDFVKYGDTKNAALLAFTSAWLAGIGNTILHADAALAPLILMTLYLAAAMFLIGCGFALAALLPFTSAQEVLNNFTTTFRGLFRGPSKPLVPNLLYFGHIQHLNEDEFAVGFRERYRPNRHVFTDTFVADVCSQTLINSKIAQRKFNRFNSGLVFVLAGLLLVFAAFGLSLVRAVAITYF